MFKQSERVLKTTLAAGVAMLALAAMPVALPGVPAGLGLIGTAHAADDGTGGKGKMQQGGQSGAAKGQGAGTIGGAGKGQGGPDASSDGKGPRASMPDGGSRGGKPVWAQEGIPEVELGRLNVARAPAHVIERALEEALLNWTDAMTTNYALTLAEYVAALKANYDTFVRIDSPLENLGLYQDLMSDGVSSTPVQPGTVDAMLDLAAIYFGAASDKTVAVSVDSVTAINAILGLTVDAATTAAIAERAEAVRQAIAEAHG